MNSPLRSLDLAPVGNGRLGWLIDPLGTIVWGCWPRLDADAVFCALLDRPTDRGTRGLWSFELDGPGSSEQSYLPNTAILVTRLSDARGNAVQIVDCAPRYRLHDRLYSPPQFVRLVTPLAGRPTIVTRLRPSFDWGSETPSGICGSNHLRYQGREGGLRLTTDGSLSAIIEERPQLVDRPLAFVLGYDEALPNSPGAVARTAIEETSAYWRQWVRGLAIPYEWQDEVIRAAITLKLNTDEDTGAIVAALTTSIPESPASTRNWDYRYCWLRDGYFVVDALNSLGATATMEGYLRYVSTIVTNVANSGLQPVYRISGSESLDERVIETLPGYRGMGPVRVGNQAARQVQHDVYGAVVLAVTHMFFDRRLARTGDAALFDQLESLGKRAIDVYDKPDAGPWELRGRQRVHTWSSLMCWAACDRLARIATRIRLPDRAVYWRGEADAIREFIEHRCWNPRLKSYVASAGGESLDASGLLLAELNFLSPDDSRFRTTVDAIGRELRRGDHVYRYLETDDFGRPQNAFVACAFWYINALAALGRRDEARAMFERVLGFRTRLGFYAEHVDPDSGEPWGNFVQTYSMVGLISAARRLSMPWEEAF